MLLDPLLSQGKADRFPTSNPTQQDEVHSEAKIEFDGTLEKHADGECLNGVTSSLKEDFDDPDDPDVVSLAEIEPSVQIEANTDQNEQIAGPSSKKRSRVD